MGLIENPNFVARYEGVIDRKSMFMAVQSMQNIWWQIANIDDFDFGSVVTETIKAGCYGWTLDGITGHAYLVPYGKQVKLQPGYKGLIDLVHRSDQCEPSMEAVYEGDTYEYLGRFCEPKHVRGTDPLRRSKPVTNAYIVAAFRSGIIKCFSWTVQECIAHRDRFSKGWAGVRNKPDKALNHPWCETHPGFWVMCCKTVLTNAVNRGELPISMKDLRGKESMLSLSDDDTPTIDGTTGLVEPMPREPKRAAGEPETSDIPVGYQGTLHQEPVEGYVVESAGDAEAAGDAKHVGDQTPAETGTVDPVAEMRETIRGLTNPEDAKRLAQEAIALGLADLLDEKIRAMQTKAGSKPRQTKLPGEQ